MDVSQNISSTHTCPDVDSNEFGLQFSEDLTKCDTICFYIICFKYSFFSHLYIPQISTKKNKKKTGELKNSLLLKLVEGMPQMITFVIFIS